MALSNLWYRLFLTAEQAACRNRRLGGDYWQREGKRGGTTPLTGIYAHWCYEWDEMPVDETTPEFECCSCYEGWRFRAVRWLSGKVVNYVLQYKEWRMRKRVDYVNKSVAAGALSINQARALFGFGPLPGKQNGEPYPFSWAENFHRLPILPETQPPPSDETYITQKLGNGKLQQLWINGVEYVPKEQLSGVLILPPGVSFQPIVEVSDSNGVEYVPAPESRAHMATLEIEDDKR